ncbi:hypothetical protein BZG36_00017 [Bifiguratus adelaidae]|uniref:PH domain-containing protein n=1 Tax=Bifiguratus adelaidae TaxID=1938954 RepID=A0A261Y8U2_9FUNG|nr:hypothetical protein BZG36_00017 [Bifiguratus adelaidae]
MDQDSVTTEPLKPQGATMENQQQVEHVSEHLTSETGTTPLTGDKQATARDNDGLEAKHDGDISQERRQQLAHLERELSAVRGSSPMVYDANAKVSRNMSLTDQLAAIANGSPIPQPSVSSKLAGYPHPTQSLSGTTLGMGASLLPAPPQQLSPTKRRAKVSNANRRNTDIEFATEIGQGLLVEVRKLQATLQERDEQIRQLETARADMERNTELLSKQLRQSEENKERLKEEGWNIEMRNEQLEATVKELTQNLTKSTKEHQKALRVAAAYSEQVEALKDKENALSATLEATKAKLEQDLLNLKRQSLALNREKAELQKQVETLNNDIAVRNAKLGRRTPSSQFADQDDLPNSPQKSHLRDLNQETPNNTPPASPTRSPSRTQDLEAETLKQSLGHAHKMISTLRSNLYREKSEKIENKKLIAEYQDTIDSLRKELSQLKGVPGESGRRKAKQSGTPKRRKMIARRPRGMVHTDKDMSMQEEGFTTEEAVSGIEDEEGYLKPGGSPSLPNMRLGASEWSGTDSDFLPGDIHTGLTSDEEENRSQGSFMDEAGDNPFLAPPSVPHRGVARQLFVSSAEYEDKAVMTEEPWPTLGEQERGEEEAEEEDIHLQGSTFSAFPRKASDLGSLADELGRSTPDIVALDNGAPTAGPSIGETSMEDAVAAALQKANDEGTIVDKAEVDHLTQEALAVATTAFAIEKAQAIEKASADAITSAEAEGRYLSKDDADKLIQEARAAAEAKALEDLKAREAAIASQAVQDALTGGSVLTKEAADALVTAAIADHFTKADVDKLVQEAQTAAEAKAAQDLKAREPDIAKQAIADALAGGSILTKEAANGLVAAAVASAVEDAQTKTQQAITTAIEEAKQNGTLLTKEHVDDLVDSSVTSAVEKARQEAEAMVEASKQEAIREGVSQGRLMHAQDVEELTKQRIALAFEEASKDGTYVTKADADRLIQEATVAGITGAVAEGRVISSERHTTLIQEALDALQSESADALKVELQRARDDAINVAKANGSLVPADVVSQRISKAVQDALEDAKKSGVLVSKEAVELQIAQALERAAEKASIEIQQAVEEASAQVIERAKSQGILFDESTASQMCADAASTALSEAIASGRHVTKEAADALIEGAGVIAVQTATSNGDLVSKELAKEMVELAVAAAQKTTAPVTAFVSQPNDAHEKDDITSYWRPLAEPSNSDPQDVHIEEEPLTLDALNTTPETNISSEPVVPSSKPPADLLAKSSQRNALVSSQLFRKSNGSTKESLDPHRASMSKTHTEPLNFTSRANQPQKSTSSHSDTRPYYSQTHTSPNEYGTATVFRKSMRTMNSATSISTMSTEDWGDRHVPQMEPPSAAIQTSDPALIAAITQTMVGDWLWKYTRRPLGSGLSEKRNKRYFWVHPYTCTIYWGTKQPGVNLSEMKAKSAPIEAVYVIDNPTSAKEAKSCLIIKTPNRELKLVALDETNHNNWYQGLSYLVSRNQQNAENHGTSTIRSRTSISGTSMLNRSIGHRHSSQMLSNSHRSRPTTPAVEDHDTTDDELENVRTCCDGKHDVTRLDKGHSHHYHLHHKV